MTVNDLAKIFYSNYLASTDWDELSEISWMLENNLLSFNKSWVCSHRQFINKVSLIQEERFKHVIESGDGIRHQALKLIVTNLLNAKYGIDLTDILYEHVFLGFEVDVIDKNLGYPTECGDSNPQKLEKYLASPTVKHVLILPYPLDGRDPQVFIFSARPEFQKYISFKNDFIRKKFRRNSTRFRKE